MIKFLFLSLCLIVPSSRSTLETPYQYGETWGKEPPPPIDPILLKQTLGFHTDSPMETSFWDHPHTLSSTATDRLHTPPLDRETPDSSSLLLATERQRGRLPIDPTRDPLIVASNHVINNPAGAISAHQVPEYIPSCQKTSHVCFESGERAPRTCSLHRHVTLKAIPVTTFPLLIHTRLHSKDPAYGGPQEAVFDILSGQNQGESIMHIAGPGFDGALEDRIHTISLHSHHVINRGDFDSLGYNLVLEGTNLRMPKIDHIRYKKKNRKKLHAWLWYGLHIEIHIHYTPLPTHADLIETIEDTCSAIEALCDEGQCHYGSEKIIEGEDARLIQNGTDHLMVTRPWWHKKRTYYCPTPSLNNCTPLRKRGCVQIHSECHQTSGKACVEWKQTFECPHTIQRPSRSSLTGNNLPFGLDGKMVDSTWKANEDMTHVLTTLSLLKEIRRDVGSMKTLTLFPGTTLGCSKHCLNFSDCCALTSGWGEHLKLTQCSASEKLLGEKRRSGTCHLVGTYCAQRAPLTRTCLRKKTMFCCFDSKLARLIHEQGRQQLGRGWGMPEVPDCRALTLEEFTRIRFENLDLSEMYKDVLERINVPSMEKTVQNFQKDWKARLPTSREIPGETTMKNHIDVRVQEVSYQKNPGSYTLHHPSPLRESQEEEAPHLVF